MYQNAYNNANALLLNLFQSVISSDLPLTFPGVSPPTLAALAGGEPGPSRCWGGSQCRALNRPEDDMVAKKITVSKEASFPLFECLPSWLGNVYQLALRPLRFHKKLNVMPMTSELVCSHRCCPRHFVQGFYGHTHKLRRFKQAHGLLLCGVQHFWALSWSNHFHCSCLWCLAAQVLRTLHNGVQGDLSLPSADKKSLGRNAAKKSLSGEPKAISEYFRINQAELTLIHEDPHLKHL